MRRLLVAGMVLAAAAPAAAAGGPVVTAQRDTVPAGQRYLLEGSGWSTAAGCERRVHVVRTLGHGFHVGTAELDAEGAFGFSRRIPRGTPRGSRMTFDVVQYCDGLAGDPRSVTVRVGRSRLCRGAMSVDDGAYRVATFGRLRCADGMAAIGPFIDTGIDPGTFDCAHVDRREAGHDYVCVDTEHPGRRVTARRVSEV